MNPHHMSVEHVIESLKKGDVEIALRDLERIQTSLQYERDEHDKDSSHTYFEDVKATAQDALDQAKEHYTEPDEVRDAAYDALHECVDSSWWVVYTHANMKVLQYSDNDGAYVDEYGEDGLVENGQLNWAKLAYAAMYADARERLDELLAEYEDGAEALDEEGAVEPDFPDEENAA